MFTSEALQTALVIVLNGIGNVNIVKQILQEYHWILDLMALMETTSHSPD